jgi:hypothetical protein
MVRTCSHAVQYSTYFIYCIISIYVEGGTVANLFSYLLCTVLYRFWLKGAYGTEHCKNGVRPPPPPRPRNPYQSWWARGW